MVLAVVGGPSGAGIVDSVVPPAVVADGKPGGDLPPSADPSSAVVYSDTEADPSSAVVASAGASSAVVPSAVAGIVAEIADANH